MQASNTRRESQHALMVSSPLVGFSQHESDAVNFFLPVEYRPLSARIGRSVYAITNETASLSCPGG
ncbi:MAG: hypothetical protein ACRD7E_09915, partial [Bryobacteraceae bacterium]